MDYLLCKTRGNARPDGKPRVYLTCHPDDVERWVEQVIADLHAANDCTVFLANDMASDFVGEEWELDLGRMQLFVVPVTYRLLSEPNRAMDVDVPFALERKIPVLPVMMESGISGLYSSHFGKLQYLSPLGDGRGGGIGYAQKLGQYLESVLVGSEEAARIRDAFDAYVFLSYRKVDRRFADDLMRLIHADPRCRDIAVWYDEFLTPGESFRENISRALESSKLFALLVTPNVLERPGGRPNFVMGVEYPAARDASLDVIAAEAVETDAPGLAAGFDGLPEPFLLWDEDARSRLLDVIAHCATESNDDDPTHNYLVGLAYLKGIDVEVDAERGVELVTAAAEAGLQEALERVLTIYGEGDGAALDYAKAAMWAERLYKHCKANHGEEHSDTIAALHVLAIYHDKLGNHEKAAAIGEEVLRLSRKALGETDRGTLAAICNLASYKASSGDHERAAELGREAWRLQCESLGETHLDTLTSLSNLACYLKDLGDCRKGAELGEEAWRLCSESLGETHPVTLSSLSNLACFLCDLDDYQRAVSYGEDAWRLRRETLGETHPDTLESLENLAAAYRGLGDSKKAIELVEEAWRLRRETLGETHPDTLESLENLAAYYFDMSNFKKAAEFFRQVWRLRRETLGETHPDTLASLRRLMVCLEKLGDRKGVVKLNKMLWRLIGGRTR